MKRCFLVLFLFVASVYLPAQTVDCASLTHQALELSGFNEYIDRLAAIFGSPEFMQQFRGRQSSEDFNAVYKPILLKEFNPALLRREMQKRVSTRCNAEQMAQTVGQLQTPVQARMLALEAAGQHARRTGKVAEIYQHRQNGAADGRPDRGSRCG